MDAFLEIKHWGKFQHYRNRRPPWIKLHREILDDFEFHSLSDASKALAPCLWLIASEYEHGHIPVDLPMIAFRLRMSIDKAERCLKELILKGFVLDASGALATRKQDAIPETEVETETEEILSRSALVRIDEFEMFWEKYPRREGKQDARRSWTRNRCEGHLGELLAALADWTRARAPEYMPYASRWLSKGFWRDIPTVEGGRNGANRSNHSERTKRTLAVAERMFAMADEGTDEMRSALPARDNRG